VGNAEQSGLFELEPAESQKSVSWVRLRRDERHPLNLEYILRRPKT